MQGFNIHLYLKLRFLASFRLFKEKSNFMDYSDVTTEKPYLRGPYKIMHKILHQYLEGTLTKSVLGKYIS